MRGLGEGKEGEGQKGSNEVEGLSESCEGTSWKVRGRLCDVGRRIRDDLREGR